MKSLVLILILSAVAAQAEVGFKNGNNLTAAISVGEITIQCPTNPVGGGPSWGSFLCRQDILIPAEYDYFQGPPGVNADEVTLTALHEDGSQRSKTVGYDSKLGHSSKRVNLWIATLLQRPLLNGGVNRVSYHLTKDGKTVDRGEFVAVVKDGGEKVCSRRGHYWSQDSMACQTGGSYCHQYFDENNYCL